MILLCVWMYLVLALTLIAVGARGLAVQGAAGHRGVAKRPFELVAEITTAARRSLLKEKETANTNERQQFPRSARWLKLAAKHRHTAESTTHEPGLGLNKSSRTKTHKREEHKWTCQSIKSHQPITFPRDSSCRPDDTRLACGSLIVAAAATAAPAAGAAAGAAAAEVKERGWPPTSVLLDEGFEFPDSSGISSSVWPSPSCSLLPVADWLPASWLLDCCAIMSPITASSWLVVQGRGAV